MPSTAIIQTMHLLHCCVDSMSKYDTIVRQLMSNSQYKQNTSYS